MTEKILMNENSKIAVCSRSFSQNLRLREMLKSKFKNITFNESGKTLKGNELIEFLRGHVGAIVGLETIDNSILLNTPELKVIGKYGVGLDKLDFEAMERHNVQLGWTPGVNARAVAELTISLALILVRKIHLSHKLILTGGWGQVQGRQLSSMTFGILGCGHVGKELVELLKGFGCRILAHDVIDMSDFYLQHDVKSVDFDELLLKSDILSIHIPKNSLTQNILSKENLLKMKSGSILINTARGGLVDEVALLELLQKGHLQGAGFDVFFDEPPQNTALINHPHFFSTTHIGGSSEEAVLAMGVAAIEGLFKYKRAGLYEK